MNQPSNYLFCCHTGEIATDFVGDGFTIITFAPAEYWRKNECLPNYSFYEQIGNFLPTDYQIVGFCEETMWASTKSIEEVKSEMAALGFVESVAMEQFLTNCWG